MFKVNNKYIRMMPLMTFTMMTFTSVTTADFEEVNNSWALQHQLIMDTLYGKMNLIWRFFKFVKIKIIYTFHVAHTFLRCSVMYGQCQFSLLL